MKEWREDCIDYRSQVGFGKFMVLSTPSLTFYIIYKFLVLSFG